MKDASADRAVITLTTDFGWQDSFAGVMKGVIIGLNPEAVIIDLAHDLTAHCIEEAAFTLWSSFNYFPEKTIHVAVVDPGVGSGRHILAVKAGGFYFVAPDNGLLSYVLDEIGDYQIRLVNNPDMMLESVSRTFHGRDIMAPVAAHLSLGFPFEMLGPTMDRPVRLKPLYPDSGEGRIIHVDRFGNLITNIKPPETELWDDVLIETGEVVIKGVSLHYAQAAAGEYLAVAGSHGFLEIARNSARAEDPPALTLNSAVRLRSSKQD